MSGLLTVQCDQALPYAPEWVHLVPMGQITARDGRRFVNDAPQAVIEAFEANGIDLPIDYEHANDNPRAKLAGPVPAAGWIKELAARSDGIWGRVEWTDRARTMISAREYRFLSPSLLIDKATGQIARLKGAGLVHNPALHITALASEQEPTMPSPDFMTRLAQLLKLEEGATEDDILAALAKRMDPREFAPVEAFREQFGAHSTELAAFREAHVTEKVEKAVRDGHLTPAAREWALDLCRVDEASFDTFLASSPRPYAHLFEVTNAAKPHPGKDRAGQHSPEAELLAGQLGIDPARLA